MNILQEKNEKLRLISEKVGEIDSTVKDLVRQMETLAIIKDGAGLAAPQVGVNQRVVIIRDLQLRTREYIKMINPEIISKSRGMQKGEEGCLSIKDGWTKGDVKRHISVKVKWLGLDGKSRCKVFKYLTARIIQHEIDHLDGILFTDKAEKGSLI